MLTKLPLLVDNWHYVPHLVESKGDGSGKLVVKGEFARSDRATENNRLYGKALWEREVSKLAKNMEARKVFGECDHPADGRTSVNRISHVITKMWMEGNILMGEAEILPTTHGNNLRAIIESGCAMGVSSRGFGTVRQVEGKDVVNDDYRLMTFDFVTDPADQTAYPTIKNEDTAPKAAAVQERTMSVKNIRTLSELKESNPNLFASLRDDAQREFERNGAKILAQKVEQAREEAKAEMEARYAENLKATLEDAKSEVAKMERERLLNDPEVAAAKTALEDIKAMLRPFIVGSDVDAAISAKDEEVSVANSKASDLELEVIKLRQENAEYASLAKEAGYKYHLDSVTQGHEYAGLIKKMVGDVKQYESVEALNAKIDDITSEISKGQAKQEARDAEIKRLETENAKLKLATEEALRAVEELAEQAKLIEVEKIEADKQAKIQMHLETRLRNHPKADQIRTLAESKSFGSVESVDDLITKFREPQASSASIEETRQRVRAMVGAKTQEYLSEDKKTISPNHDNNKVQGNNYLGQDIKELRALSGMVDPQ